MTCALNHISAASSLNGVRRKRPAMYMAFRRSVMCAALAWVFAPLQDGFMIKIPFNSTSDGGGRELEREVEAMRAVGVAVATIALMLGAGPTAAESPRE